MRREMWLDSTRILACVLVTLGHLLQGLYHANLMSSQYMYEWFERTIYYFHVPLFFICSGYLYQARSVVNSFSSWKDNATKKLIALGVPYFVFSLATWAFKNIFSGAVNNETNSLLYDLFVVPQSPYWFLYALFLMFLVMPTFSRKRGCIIGVVIALGLKFINMATGEIGIYAVNVVMGRLIWFVIGMALCVAGMPARVQCSKHLRCVGVALIVGFVLVSLAITRLALEIKLLSFGMGLWACAAIVMLFWSAKKEYKWMQKATNYTMPVFLMHTIFAAGVRAALLKLGVHNLAVHIAVGLAASFLGPIIAFEIMQKLKLDILIYPLKYVRRAQEKKTEQV